MKSSKHLPSLLVLGMLTVPASMTFAATSIPIPVVAQAPAAARPAEAPAPGYAAREAASAAQLEGFQGGHSGVYIGGSGVAIVLLIVLLVILL